MGLAQHFDHIYSLSNNLAASKLQRGHDLVECSCLDPKKTLLICDTDHDLEVAQSLEIDILLIADSHQNYHRLKAIHRSALLTRY